MEANTTNDLFEQQTRPKPRGALNVLTILTIIACILGYCSIAYSYITDKDFEKNMAKMEEAKDKTTPGSFTYKMLDSSMEMTQKTHENFAIIMLSNLLFNTLCFVGALQMRKLKKSGYPLYVIGELALFPILIGVAGLSPVKYLQIGGGLVIAVIFVILYTTQRKHLVNP